MTAAQVTLIPLVEVIYSSVVSLQEEVTFDCTIYTNPYFLVQGSGKASVYDNRKLLSEERKMRCYPSGAKITGIDHFSQHGLSVLKTFSVISEIKRKVASEASTNYFHTKRTSHPSRHSLEQTKLLSSYAL